MGRVMLVTSGKGGTGKSTVALNLALSLAKEGGKTVLLELDSGLRCLDLMLGIDGIVYDLGDVLRGACNVQQAVYPALQGVSLVAAAADVGFLPDRERLSQLCRYLAGQYDFVIMDTPAGLGKMLDTAAAAADEALIVTNLTPVSVRDAEKAADQLGACGLKQRRLIINRVPKKTPFPREIMDADDIIDRVGTQLIAIVPEDPVLQQAAHLRTVRDSKGSLALEVFERLAKRLCGQDVPLLIQ